MTDADAIRLNELAEDMARARSHFDWLDSTNNNTHDALVDYQESQAAFQKELDQICKRDNE